MKLFKLQCTIIQAHPNFHSSNVPTIGIFLERDYRALAQLERSDELRPHMVLNTAHPALHSLVHGLSARRAHSSCDQDPGV